MWIIEEFMNIVQIGSNGGKDDAYDYIQKNSSKIDNLLLIEPLVEFNNVLKDQYSDINNLYIENIVIVDDENIKEKLNIINLKYENLIQDCAFEDIPQKNKTNVAKLFGDANRYLPIQLNGTSGNNIVKRQPKILTQKDVSLVTVNDSSEENIKRAKANLDIEANLEV